MKDRKFVRRSAAVAAPVVVALLAATWLIWIRGDPARQGGYCANATVDLATVFETSAASSDPGLGLVPEPNAILRASVQVDVRRLQIGTPVPVAADVATLKTALPGYRAARDRAERQGRAAPEVPREVASAFVRIFTDYIERCG